MEDKIKEIIAEQLNCNLDMIDYKTSFKDDLSADSLDLYQLVMALEDEYSIEIASEDLDKLTTVGSVIEYLKEKGLE